MARLIAKLIRVRPDQEEWLQEKGRQALTVRQAIDLAMKAEEMASDPKRLRMERKE